MPPLCACGEKYQFVECSYINPDARLKDFKPDRAIQAKVDEKLKDKQYQEKVNNSLTRSKRIKESSQYANTQEQS